MPETPLKRRMDSQESSLMWAKSKQNKNAWTAKGWAALAYKLNCSQNPFKAKKNQMCQAVYRAQSLHWSLKTAVLQSPVWLISVLLQHWHQERKSIVISCIYVSNYVLIWLTENACVCKGTLYTFLAILYISLFYSRVLRAQGCKGMAFFQIETKFKYNTRAILMRD